MYVPLYLGTSPKSRPVGFSSFSSSFGEEIVKARKLKLKLVHLNQAFNNLIVKSKAQNYQLE
jgi:hypothetical protein